MGPGTDILFHYSKRTDSPWNPMHVPHSEEYVAAKYRFKDADGRLYRLDNMTSPSPGRT